MDQAVVKRVVEELRSVLVGRYVGKVYQLTTVSFAIDLGLRGEFLFISVDPASPRLYLIHRRTKDLEKQSVPLNTFGQMMRAKLGGAYVLNISKDPLDRIVRVTFRIDSHFRKLAIQLTGRTADIFLLDELNRIEAILREPGQTRINERYQPPPRPSKESNSPLQIGPGPASPQLDKHFAALDAARVFDTKAKTLRSKLTKAIRQQQTLTAHLRDDLAGHGELGSCLGDEAAQLLVAAEGLPDVGDHGLWGEEGNSGVGIAGLLGVQEGADRGGQLFCVLVGIHVLERAGSRSARVKNWTLSQGESANCCHVGDR